MSQDLSVSAVKDKICSGDFRGVEKYLLDGGNPNAVDEFGQSLLTTAILQQNLEIIKFLKERGARTDIKDNTGLTPEHYILLIANRSISTLFDPKD
ncbi:ankyrin repeat domain-containing protein [Rhodoplanes azumiensis]|uniref:Ankyrin repeat domain-containing protein n=1 Tax=Rhodoplanes azumiensis TaxID=1897628 RepID=A0ABW5APC4_9BRAD